MCAYMWGTEGQPTEGQQYQIARGGITALAVSADVTAKEPSITAKEPWYLAGKEPYITERALLTRRPPQVSADDCTLFAAAEDGSLFQLDIHLTDNLTSEVIRGSFGDM